MKKTLVVIGVMLTMKNAATLPIIIGRRKLLPGSYCTDETGMEFAVADASATDVSATISDSSVESGSVLNTNLQIYYGVEKSK